MSSRVTNSSGSPLAKRDNCEAIWIPQAAQSSKYATNAKTRTGISNEPVSPSNAGFIQAVQGVAQFQHCRGNGGHRKWNPKNMQAPGTLSAPDVREQSMHPRGSLQSPRKNLELNTS